MNEKLSIRQAYAAMYWYLDRYYQHTRSDEIGGLLGSMSLLQGGSPADPAIWPDWLKAVERAVQHGDQGIDLELH